MSQDRNPRSRPWHSINLLPRHQHGARAAARGCRNRDAPRANQQLRRGYIQSWNLIVERRLPYDGRVGRVCGSASVRAFAFLNVNASQIPGSGDDGRPVPDIRTHIGNRGVRWPDCHALPFTADHAQPSLQGWPAAEGHTWSRAIDERPTPTGRSSSGTRRACPPQPRKGDHNIPHNFQLGWVYDFRSAPGRRGRRLAPAARSWEAGS